MLPFPSPPSPLRGNQAPPLELDLAQARAEFDTRTQHQFSLVTDYPLMAEYSALRGWVTLAAVFFEETNRIASEIS